MGRQVRKVPADWQHPKDEDGYPIPLMDGADFHKHCASAEKHEEPAPDPRDYMPIWSPEEATHFMMYEDTSEGTPISPAFADIASLAKWLADSKASIFAYDTASEEEWLSICSRGGYTAIGIGDDGIGYV